MRGEIVTLSTSTSTKTPHHKTSKKRKEKKKNDISKQHSKQAIRQGNFRKNYKMFANPVFITPGRLKINNFFLVFRIS